MITGNERIPLHSTTWGLDNSEGEHVSHVKETHTKPFASPVIEVPDDLDRNLAVTSVDESAKAAGRLYALSTMGSIIGSFLPALVLIPLLGVQRTYIAIGTVFIIVSAIGLLSGMKWSKIQLRK